ncbi:unnamed protein product [Litomosoides sigmodontis]|uniref:Caveolin n=1 Tax=Litomosoides sigmodontis TaxID=42156 RepID=A0A3P6T144_LITSI|nr:unnamed protein product [Litomosoides sigmodontis]
MCDLTEVIEAKGVPVKWEPETLEAETNSTKEESGDKKRKKICKIWQRKSPRSYNVGGKKSKVTNGMHFISRDKRGLNNHVIMDFGQVFAEPDGSRSFNWTWLATNRIFTATSVTIYKLLATFIAIPFAVLFGVLFAIFAAISVFLCTPLGVLFGIPLNALSKSWDFIICRLLNPITKSICCQRKKNEENTVILNA